MKKLFIRTASAIGIAALLGSLFAAIGAVLFANIDFTFGTLRGWEAGGSIGLMIGVFLGAATGAIIPENIKETVTTLWRLQAVLVYSTAAVTVGLLFDVVQKMETNLPFLLYVFVPIVTVPIAMGFELRAKRLLRIRKERH